MTIGNESSKGVLSLSLPFAFHQISDACGELIGECFSDIFVSRQFDVDGKQSNTHLSRQKFILTDESDEL